MDRIERIAIGSLMPGQCFFFLPEETYAAREKEVNEIEEYRRQVGMSPLSTRLRNAYLRAFAESHIIDCFSKHTGDYFTTRLNDGKRMIWYDPETIVEWSHDTKTFDARVEEMRKSRKEIAEAQANMQKARGKKQNAPAEIAERTVRTGV